ncbi:hypothetical protein OS493_019833 [Desmophyllum pertusum]|uniref:TNF receptor-associated factor 2 n=1 Tax=Desmophyllum pertusum TaxID=174260 RepID=A0A9W9Z2B7_9CNID|nr:hypothetical protein OS493_019833 [Desmophyllum pertusum]
MAEQKNRSDFNAMNVAELKKYLQEQGVSVSGYLKTSLVEIASSVERMVLPVDPNFEKDQTNDADKLIIHDMHSQSIFPEDRGLNNFNSSPPFWVVRHRFTTPLITWNLYNCSVVCLSFTRCLSQDAYGTCKNDSRYPESWVKKPKRRSSQLLPFPGAVYKTREGKERVKNPASAPVCKEDGVVIDKSRIIPDNNTRQEVLSFTVACPYCNEGCLWKGEVRHLEHHSDMCVFHRLPCENSQCRMLVKRGEMQKHLTQQCKYRLWSCPHCDQKITYNLMKTHLQEVHSDQLFELPAQDREQNIVLSGQDNIQTPQEQIRQIQDQLNQMEILHVELHRSLDEQKMETKLLVEDSLNSTRKQQRKIEQKHTIIMHTLADLEENVRQQEFTSYDGQVLWKISDYARRRNDAVTGQQVSFYSPCFYTSRYGYKMCARLYLNGDGMGRGTHISMFFVVMRGQYDALLRWPFRQKVTFMLLDQDNVEHVSDAFRPDPSSSSFQRPRRETNIASQDNVEHVSYAFRPDPSSLSFQRPRRETNIASQDNVEHVSYAFRPDPSSSSFQRPRRETNIASGCPMFCSLAELNNHAYVRDDAMFLKIIVDTTDL